MDATDALRAAPVGFIIGGSLLPFVPLVCLCVCGVGAVVALANSPRDAERHVGYEPLPEAALNRNEAPKGEENADALVHSEV